MTAIRPLRIMLREASSPKNGRLFEPRPLERLSLDASAREVMDISLPVFGLAERLDGISERSACALMSGLHAEEDITSPSHRQNGQAALLT